MVKKQKKVSKKGKEVKNKVKKEEKKVEPILLNVFHEEQDKNGYISIEALKRMSTEMQIPISRLYGAVKFYTMLRTQPQGKYIIELCGSPSCVQNESREIEKFIEQELKIRIGETTKDKLFSVYKTSCIGCCDEPPAMLLDGKPITKLTIPRVKKLIDELRKTKTPKSKLKKK